MAESKSSRGSYLRVLLWASVLAGAIYLIVQNFNTFRNLLLVMLGFGTVVLVHEFGHFVVAKLSDINVEAFSIFFPPTILGIRRTEKGLRFRILPRIGEKEGDKEQESDKKNEDSRDAQISFTLGKGGKEWETEYRVGLIPFGGYVQMLGQSDMGPDKKIDDPRSFSNKPVRTRIPVIAAGVFFNAVSAIVIFMVVFLVGINLPPAVIGDVRPDYPAAKAGLRSGDEILEIAGKSKYLNFSNIDLAAAFSGRNEAVPMKVRHTDGTTEEISLVAERKKQDRMKRFGVFAAESLTIEKVTNAETLYEKTGLRPGDRITHVNGKAVEAHWEMVQVMRQALLPEVTLQAERPGQSEPVEVKIPIHLWFARAINVESESQLCHICSMVPRLQVAEVVKKTGTDNKDLSLFGRIRKTLVAIFSDTETRKEPEKVSEEALKAGDIILAAGDIENPTYKELRDVTVEHKDEKLALRVLRADSEGNEKEVVVEVVPGYDPDMDRVVIGIGPVLDAKHPVVAKTIDAEAGPGRLEIPRGATITAVNGASVSNFYDIARQVRERAGGQIVIEYRKDETVGKVVVNVGGGENLVVVEPLFTSIPFKPYERLYRASGPVEAIAMGWRMTVGLIAQTYATLRSLLLGFVSPKELAGPLGIMHWSYQIVTQRPFIFYVYFLGLINAVIAVFNFLPLVPLDGGFVVLLLIEKIKGKALSERTQGVMVYTGWVLIGALAIYVTFNDIIRIGKTFFS